MFGMQPDGTEKPAAMELVRLAFPRRVYTQSHVDYLVEVMEHVWALKDRIRGVKIVESAPFQCSTRALGRAPHRTLKRCFCEDLNGQNTRRIGQRRTCTRG
jgi:hypothetical protein